MARSSLFFSSQAAPNFALYNPSDKSANVSLSESNRRAAVSISSWSGVRCDLFISSGKWYAEGKVLDNDRGMFGFANSSETLSAKMGGSGNGWMLMWDAGGTWKKNNVGLETALGGSASNNDIVMLAGDITAQKFWAGANGTWFNSGDPAAGTGALFTNLTGTITVSTCLYNSDVQLNTGDASYTVTGGYSDDNGYGDFDHQPPTSFLSICDLNGAT